MAAETLVWIGYDWAAAGGSVAGQWDHLNNWQQDSGAAATHYPCKNVGDVDTAIFDGRGAAYDVTTGLNQSAAAGHLAAMKVLEGWTGALGSKTNPLRLKTNTDNGVLTYQRSNGSAWIIARFTTINILQTAGEDTLFIVPDTTAATDVNAQSHVEFPATLLGQASAGVTTFSMSQAPNLDEPNVRTECAIATFFRYSGKHWWNAGAITAYKAYGGAIACEESVTLRECTTGWQYAGDADFRCGVPGAVTFGSNAQEGWHWLGGSAPLFDPRTIIQTSVEAA